MYNSVWNDGYLNDGTFSSTVGYTLNSNTLNINVSTGLTTTTTTTIMVNIRILGVFNVDSHINIMFDNISPSATSTVIQYSTNSGFTAPTTIGGSISAPINMGLASSFPNSVLYFRVYTHGYGTYSNIVSYNNVTATTTTTTTSSYKPISSVLLRYTKTGLTFNVIGGMSPYTYQYNAVGDGTPCDVITISPDSDTIELNSATSSYSAMNYVGSNYTINVAVSDSVHPTLTFNSNYISINYTCLIPETTIVMFDKTIKMLNDIVVGDKLLTVKDNEYFETIVTSKSNHTVNKIININDGLLESSESHIHLIKVENLIIEKEASELKIGDKLIDVNGNNIIINNIEIIYGEKNVINISTDFETYIANGILTHNKAACKTI